VTDQCGNEVDCGGTAACVASDGCQYVCNEAQDGCVEDLTANGCINDNVSCGGPCCPAECGCGFDCVSGLCEPNDDVCAAYSCQTKYGADLSCKDLRSADGYTAETAKALCDGSGPADKVIWPTTNCAEQNAYPSRCEAYSVTAPVNQCDLRTVQYLYSEGLPAANCQMDLDGVDTVRPGDTWPAY
jgi:hypothetical protein